MDLNSLQCLELCEKSKVGLDLERIKVCFDFMLYVDPTSSSVIELGTISYPFKTLDDPMAFLFHYLPNSPKVPLINDKMSVKI